MTLNRTSRIRSAAPFFIAMIILVVSTVMTRAADHRWRSLFNGKDMSGWMPNKFAGEGEITLEDGKIVIGSGVALSGIRRTNGFERMNYEVEIEAMKIQGGDFFCGVTFPVGNTNATLVVGGWGGSLIGISSIDGMDASENEYTQYLRFDDNKWYTIRLRVTEKKIQAWIDGEKTIDADIDGKRVGMRLGEIEMAVPFGISTFQTTAAIRAIKVRSIPAHIPKVAFIAGRKSHGPGEHEYKKALELLQSQLEKRVEFIDSKVHYDGWPTENEMLNDVDTIVLYCDGADHDVKAYRALLGNNINVVGRQMKRGAGLVCIHYSVIVPGTAGKEFAEWLGGYFDYESGEAANHWYSKIENREFKIFPASPEHAICEGVQPYSMKEEFYYKMRFPEDKKGITPIVTFDPEKKDWEKVVGWAVERPNGHRGFGYTGGHYLKNFEQPDVQRLLLNAILWTAHAEDGEGSASGRKSSE